MCVLFQDPFRCLARGQPSVSAVDCVDVSTLIDLRRKTDVSFPPATPLFPLVTPWFHQGFFVSASTARSRYFNCLAWPQ